jgi:hypothetical protein
MRRLNVGVSHGIRMALYQRRVGDKPEIPKVYIGIYLRIFKSKRHIFLVSTQNSKRREKELEGHRGRIVGPQERLLRRIEKQRSFFPVTNKSPNLSGATAQLQ